MPFVANQFNRSDNMMWGRPSWSVAMAKAVTTVPMYYVKLLYKGDSMAHQGAHRYIKPWFQFYRHTPALMLTLWIVNAFGDMPDDDIKDSWMWLAEKFECPRNNERICMTGHEVTQLYRDIKPETVAELLPKGLI